jgi:hypothetical protein
MRLELPVHERGGWFCYRFVQSIWGNVLGGDYSSPPSSTGLLHHFDVICINGLSYRLKDPMNLVTGGEPCHDPYAAGRHVRSYHTRHVRSSTDKWRCHTPGGRSSRSCNPSARIGSGSHRAYQVSGAVSPGQLAGRFLRAGGDPSLRQPVRDVAVSFPEHDVRNPRSSVWNPAATARGRSPSGRSAASPRGPPGGWAPGRRPAPPDRRPRAPAGGAPIRWPASARQARGRIALVQMRGLAPEPRARNPRHHQDGSLLK